MPFVLANRHLGNHPAYCVTPDWAGATQRAVERLTALGHRRLGLLLPDSSVSTVRDHEQGWCAAVAQYPVERAPVMHYREPDGAGGYHLALTTLREGLSAEGAALTALVCFNDYCAHGVLQAARELGVRVPDRLSLVSFDDVIAAYTTPPLCSFDPNLHEVGAAAVDTIAQSSQWRNTRPWAPHPSFTVTLGARVARRRRQRFGTRPPAIEQRLSRSPTVTPPVALARRPC